MEFSSGNVSIGRLLALGRLIWGAVLLSIIVISGIAFIKSNNASISPEAQLAPLAIFGPIAAILGGLSIVIPMIVRRSLAGKPTTSNSLVPLVLGPALTEPVVILGFFRVLQGAPIGEFYPFLVGAVLLMLFHFPRETR